MSTTGPQGTDPRDATALDTFLAATYFHPLGSHAVEVRKGLDALSAAGLLRPQAEPTDESLVAVDSGALRELIADAIHRLSSVHEVAEVTSMLMVCVDRECDHDEGKCPEVQVKVCGTCHDDQSDAEYLREWPCDVALLMQIAQRLASEDRVARADRNGHSYRDLDAEPVEEFIAGNRAGPDECGLTLAGIRRRYRDAESKAAPVPDDEVAPCREGCGTRHHPWHDCTAGDREAGA